MGKLSLAETGLEIESHSRIFYFENHKPKAYNLRSINNITTVKVKGKIRTVTGHGGEWWE